MWLLIWWGPRAPKVLWGAESRRLQMFRDHRAPSDGSWVTKGKKGKGKRGGPSAVSVSFFLFMGEVVLLAGWRTLEWVTA
ncbi:unnamed protein product [Pieris macdunnoughi]|uniref:Uncharacterized protein n=1 Tax=Pieris macdunnoughi TaxID=345717 RepID=A0A821XKF2_9NEOP|nr:unnamed protein product [Pieris macdunnoughi]